MFNQVVSAFRTDEILAAVIFIALVAVWFFRDPEFIDGWVEWFPEYVEMSNCIHIGFT